MSEEQDMTQREQLEWAARAVGLPVIGPAFASGQFLGLSIRSEGAAGGYVWNPRDRNSDAFELMVSLWMAVDVGGGGVTAIMGEPTSIEESVGMVDRDPASATRLAIVKAAAAQGQRGRIGRLPPEHQRWIKQEDRA